MKQKSTKKMFLRLAAFLIAAIGCAARTSSPIHSGGANSNIPTLYRVPIVENERHRLGIQNAINPLTGLSVSDPSVLERRPLLIKISNAPPVVRPQSGLSSADVIFEHYAEGGQTRFAALFYSQDSDHVGSVRSVRLLDLQLADAFDAILVFSGGSRGVIDTLRESPLYPHNIISPQFGAGVPYFERFPRKDMVLEHTLFTSTFKLRDYLADRHIRSEPEFRALGMQFEAEVSPYGQSAQALTIDYASTTVYWQYDVLTGQYLRWTDGVPHLDALNGVQLAFANVVVMSAYHNEIELFPEKYLGEEKSLYIDLHNQGSASIFRDGLFYEGNWVRTEDKAGFSFVNSAGQPIFLKPGRTFFQIIRSGFERMIIDP